MAKSEAESGWPWLLIVLAAVLATVPLLLHGPSCGHDFDFHLLNFLEARQQLAHGTWPRWAFSPAFGAGEPRFLFYPPLSWMLGAMLAALLPLAMVPAGFTLVALTGAGLACYRLVRPYSSAWNATLASALYLANPYTLFTAYERTAYGELLAAALIPLLLAATLRPRPRVLGLALPLGGLWLANAPAAVLSTYALAAFAVLRLMWFGVEEDSAGAPIHLTSRKNGARGGDAVRERWGFAWTVLAGTGLGLGLAGFYLLPAALERPLVQVGMAVIPGLNVADNTLFHSVGSFPDAEGFHGVLLTASRIAVTLLGAAALALGVAFWRSRSGRQSRSGPQSRTVPSYVLPVLSLMTGLILFLLTPMSLPVWRHLPELAFLQFPWRLLALLAPMCALAVALAVPRLRTRAWVLGGVVVMLAAGMVWPAAKTFPEGCDATSSPAYVLQQFRGAGTEPTDEYTPQVADNDSLHPGNPPFWFVPEGTDLTAAPPPPGSAQGSAPDHLQMRLPGNGYVVLNRREFPGWRLQVDGRPVQPMHAERADGLITLRLPAGIHTLDLSWRHLPAELAGDAISCLSLLILVGIAIRKHI